MTTPAPQTEPKSLLGAKITIAAIVLIISASAILAIVRKSNDVERSGTPEYLCELLRSGWTTDQLAANDEWQDWPANQSPLSRGIEITSAADNGGCFDLA